MKGFRAFQRLVHLIVQEAEHADAVLQLKISVVPPFLRQRKLRRQIKLVAGMGKMDAEALHGLPLDLFDDADGLPRIFLFDRFKRTKPLPEIRQPHRDHGHALHEGRILQKIPESPGELLPVIPALAEHHLSVHLNACVVQGPDVAEGRSREAVVKHLHTELRIRGVH